MFEPEVKMKYLNGKMTPPQCGEYNFFHEAGSKPKLVLFWVRATGYVYRKGT